MPSTTITYSAQDGQRIASALGKIRGYRNAQGPRSATEAEVKQALAGVMRGWVDIVERGEAEGEISITPPELT